MEIDGGTDKALDHSYDNVFSSYKDKKIRLLKLGMLTKNIYMKKLLVTGSNGLDGSFIHADIKIGGEFDKRHPDYYKIIKK